MSVFNTSLIPVWILSLASEYCFLFHAFMQFRFALLIHLFSICDRVVFFLHNGCVAVGFICDICFLEVCATDLKFRLPLHSLIGMQIL